jgi:hypothetical protein
VGIDNEDLCVAPINWAALCIVNQDLDTSAAGGDSKQATVSIPKPKKKKSGKQRMQGRVDGTGSSQVESRVLSDPHSEDGGASAAELK